MESRKKRLLITGYLGYIGQNLAEYLKGDKSISVFGIDIKECDDLNYHKIDITVKDDLSRLILEIKPNIIIHLAGLKNLSECENNPDRANEINYISVRDICDTIVNSKLDSHLIFMSSDYVFDGKKGNYKEESTPNPTTIYGITKLKSEKYIQEKIKKSTICRTSNVFGIGSGYFDFIFTKSNNNETINAFSNARISPTYIEYFLCNIQSIIEKKIYGILHIAGNDFITRFEFAKKINTIFELNADIIPEEIPIDSSIAKESTLDSNYSQKLLKCNSIDIDTALTEIHGGIITPYFTFNDNRGKIIGINNTNNWEEINFIESEKNITRGNHYHKNTLEGIFLIEGEIKVSYFDIKNNRAWVHYYKKGAFFIIKPFINHTVFCIEKSYWINLLSTRMDKAVDIYKTE